MTDMDKKNKVPALSEREVYENVLRLYEEFEENHDRYIKTAVALLFAVPVVLTVMMFISTESKLFFLVLWIISILSIISYIVYIEHKEYWYEQILGINQEDESTEAEEENTEGIVEDVKK